MIGSANRTTRGLVAASLALALVVAACGSSTKPGIPVPVSGNSNNGGNNAGGSGSLMSGLASNLDTLDSYQFSWQITSASTGASAADTGSFETTGTVVNKPTLAYKVNDLGMMQIIVIGNQGWISMDNGSTWMASSDYSNGSSDLSSLLPDSMYGSDFDSNAADFKVAGEETKNGVDCIHYTDNTDLGLGGAALGIAGNFTADLWVAKSGNYPVSGFYGYSASAGGQSGSWSYSFEITHVNDAAANAITAPTNVTAMPS